MDRNVSGSRASGTLLLLVLACSVSATAQQDSVPLTLQSITQISRLSDLAYSPDGQRIAFVSNHTGVSKIWVISAAGGRPKMLMEGKIPENSPQWAPDGRSIAFLSSREGQVDIWTVNAGGGGPTRITNDKSKKHALRWSPQGDQIAYISDLAKKQDIYIVASSGGGSPRQLSDRTNEWDEERWAPAWSPDGKQIAFVSNRSDYYADDLWLINVDGSQLQRISTGIRVMTDPLWSHDGKYIAFNAVGNTEFWFDDASDIYLVAMPSRQVRKVTMSTYATDLNGNIHMDWAPDSRTLYFRYNMRGDTNLWAVNVEGNSVATQVTDGEGGIQSVAISPTGNQFAYVRATQLSPGDLAVMPISGGEEKRMTFWATRYQDARAPEKISFLSKDGLYINGYLYKPEHMQPGGKYPGLVSMHGGGNNAFGDGFHGLEQYLAKKGYVVLAIEYRGSSGYGRAFQLESWGGWAADQGWDGVAAADYLRSLPYLNQKVGIYGGSYGGIMTMAAVTRDSSKFQAAAPFYGIYDWTKAFEDGDRLMKFWVVMGMKGFKPDENPAMYYRDSTVNFVSNITTPLLIEHGELDRRAPFPQSLELVDALKKNGKVFDYFRFPNEQHGIRQPDNYVKAYTRMEAWFDKYLKGSALAPTRPTVGGAAQ